MKPLTTSRSRSLWKTGAIGLCVFGLALGAEPGDIILILRNGDRITGRIVREDARRVVVKSAVAGRITLAPSEILRHDVPGAVAETPIVVAPASPPSSKPAPASPVSAAQTASAVAVAQPVPVPSVTNAPPVPAMKLQSWLPSWLDPFATNWHGTVGMGMSLGFGTTERQTFYANANVSHAYKRLIVSANYSAAYGVVDNIESANRMEGTVKTDLFVDRRKRLYVYNLALGGYDDIRLIDRRLEEGMGFGYRIVDRPRFIMNLELGGQYQSFDYTLQNARELWSVRISENLTWKPSDKFNLTQRFQYLPNVLNTADYRVRFDLIATYPLFKRITVSLNAVNEYESLPAVGVDNNDLQITTNVNVTF